MAGLSWMRCAGGFAGAAFLALVLACSGCRIRSSAPYWIETHGSATGSRVAGWSLGVLLLGSNRQLWAYPGGWSNPWPAQAQTHELSAVAASNTTGYAIASDGQVLRFAGNHWSPYAGSRDWHASEIAATEDDRLLVLADGKLTRVEDGRLQPLSCDSVTGSAIAAAGPDEAFMLDEAGLLYLSAGGRCDHVAAPTRLRRIAGNARRLLAVGADGSIWRRRKNEWTLLPAPTKYRPGQEARATRAEDVALSANSSWLVDREGAVFLLSDEA